MGKIKKRRQYRKRQIEHFKQPSTKDVKQKELTIFSSEDFTKQKRLTEC